MAGRGVLLVFDEGGAMKFEIKHRFTGNVLFALECDNLKICLETAVKSYSNLSYSDLSGSNLRDSNLRDSNLSGSNLSYSNLSGSDLSGSNLSGSNLSYSNLSGSNLSYSNLSGSDLSGSNLRGSNLRGSNLSYSNLSGSNLSGSNLSGSDLRYSNLSYSNLSGSNLRDSNLRGSNLSGSNLSGSKNAARIIAYTRILPEGQIIGYKKGSKGEIIKLSIPANAKRSHAFGRKCRAEFADVLEISNGKKSAFNGTHDNKIEYRVGKRVTADKWDSDFTNECSHGIHFFITKIEAEDWA
jgi:uncharacterized protein YjbI with pentapeptide repeats